MWGFPQIDSAAVDRGAVELDDLIFRRTSFPPNKLSAGLDGDYIWLALLTGLSVRTRSVTGSLPFRSPQRFVRSCLCWAALSLRWIGSADVPLCCHLVSAVSRRASHKVEMYFLPPCFRLILTIGYCFFRFFREQDISSSRLSDRNQADPFHAPTRLAKLYDFAPDKMPLNYGQQDLRYTWTVCKLRVGYTQSENCTIGGNYIQTDFTRRCARPPGDQIRGTTQIDGQHEPHNLLTFSQVSTDQGKI